jgi:hypothetical protein
MKKRIFITVTVIIISIASFNSLNNQISDYSINELGGAAIYYGLRSESPTLTDVGGWVASGGGSLIGGTAIACGAKAAGVTGTIVAVLSSNPVTFTLVGIGLIF